MVQSEGNMSLKNPVTPPGIDPGTVRLVAQQKGQTEQKIIHVFSVHFTKDLLQKRYK